MTSRLLVLSNRLHLITFKKVFFKYVYLLLDIIYILWLASCFTRWHNNNTTSKVIIILSDIQWKYHTREWYTTWKIFHILLQMTAYFMGLEASKLQVLIYNNDMLLLLNNRNNGLYIPQVEIFQKITIKFLLFLVQYACINFLLSGGNDLRFENVVE